MNLLAIKFLGGAKRIGQNATLFQFKKEDLLIDAGLNFPADKSYGVQYLIPDFKRALKNHEQRLKKVIITHAHEDHIGAIPHLLDWYPHLEIYCSALVQAFIEKKLSYERKKRKLKFHSLDSLTIDNFKIYPLPINHSVPETNILVFESPEAVLLFASDFKIDLHQPYEQPFNLKALEQFQHKKIRYLLAGSTAIFSPKKTPSEGDLLPQIEAILKKPNKRIFVTLFSSHFHRIQSFVNIAKKYNREIYFSGKSLLQNIKIGKQLGLLNIDSYHDLREKDSLLSHENSLIFCAGCQGDPRSALSQIIFGKTKTKLQQDDLIVFSSRPIPGTGNDRFIYRLYDKATEQEAEIITSEETLIHASGHPAQEDLHLLLKAFKPTHFTPVHGDTYYLHKHIKFIKEHYPEVYPMLALNYDTLHLDESGRLTKTSEEALPSLAYNNNKILLEEETLKERQRIAERGVLILMPQGEKIRFHSIGLPREAKNYCKRFQSKQNFQLASFKKGLEHLLGSRVEIISFL